jgi:hypothetical protein
VILKISYSRVTMIWQFRYTSAIRLSGYTILYAWALTAS